MPHLEYRKYLQPDVVSRLSRLDLVAKLVVEGFITGLHRSPYHGFSVEFSEYRPYLPGEPIKNIDWKIWGRTDRFYVKLFEEETNLKAYILIDASASMGYGSREISKLQYAIYLAASLSYLMFLQRDAVGLAAFDVKLRTYIPPRSAFSYLHVLLSEIGALKPSGETDISVILHRLAERIKRRGLILIFSDLLDNQESVLAALKHFRHQKHEVIVFHILDPTEKRLSFGSDTVFIDAETGERLHTDPRHMRSEYNRSMHQFIERYKRECRGSKIDYVETDTAQAFDVALFRYLARRKKIGG
jgi:uncharacterized protein (DUF58 family)